MMFTLFGKTSRGVVSYQDETHAGRHEMDFYDGIDEYYIDKDECLKYIEILEAEAREMDMT